ncbi:hypothetical protein PUMCH_002243 [Australozyma saopauloensis]|uniref:Spindle pole body component n=1 Tax=Australozyma saopauloensis TaxID=291208 RepID=A0AAX4H930_9ASCO|nr:hypothetical protein PUMCH_002243 [[Candida] saopauloensis]
MFHQTLAQSERPTTVRLSTSNFFDACTDISWGSSQAKFAPLSDEMDIKTQEALITFDLLHALLGYEGTYIRFSERFNKNVLHDRIHGPDHKVAKHLDVSLKSITKKLLRYGKYHMGLKAFAEMYEHSLFGKVNQRLCWQIRALLAEYSQMVAQQEQSFHRMATFSLRTMDNELSEKFADKLRHMYEIACTVHGITEERNPSFRDASAVPETIALDLAGRGTKFDAFLDSVRSDIMLNGSAEVSSDFEPYSVCKGGLTLRVVQNRLYQFKGDPISSQYLASVFEDISKDYLKSLNLWLSAGDIEDPFAEFFVRRNELPQNLFYSNMEKYWHELYVIKSDGILDQFENKSIQTKILLTGKYLNIFKQCTENAPIDSLPAYLLKMPQSPQIESLFAPDLALLVTQFYDRANYLLLKLLFEGFYLKEILQSLHQTFLMADSSRVDTFLDRKLHELSRGKTGSSIVAPTIAFNDMVLSKKDEWNALGLDIEGTEAQISIPGILQQFESFSIDSKSFYDIAEEILEIKSFDAEKLIPAHENASVAIRKIVTQSLQKRPELTETDRLAPAESFEDAIIAGVNIDIRLPFPLNLILKENFLFEYQLMFKFQMMLKYTAKFIDHIWQSASSSIAWRSKSHLKSVQKLILRCQILVSRMKSFINAIEDHVALSIVDTNYSILQTQLQKCLEWTRNGIANTNAPHVSSSNFLSEDTQFLMSHGSNNNDVFDEKISKTHSRKAMGMNSEKELAVNGVIPLGEHLGLFLSNSLRDLMITDGNLLQHIRKLLNEIVDYSSTVSRLKKSLILMNADLLQNYSQRFPDKFGTIEISEVIVEQRVARLNEVMTWNWSRFNNSLSEFTQELQRAGAENPAMQSLAEKLALI